MNNFLKLCFITLLSSSLITGCSYKDTTNNKNEEPKKESAENIVKENKIGKYTMPDEKSNHEGTWLQWPHEFTYGNSYKSKIEPIWVEMTKALSEGENVHIVAYNQDEKERIWNLLSNSEIPMEKINFFIHPIDDVWARDNGPIFVYDKNNNLKIMDWGFNGWGKKTPFEKDALLRQNISNDLGIERIDLTKVVIEGGAIELDGNGTCLSTMSAVTNKNRNPNLSESEIESYLKDNLGVTNFIWLDGKAGSDITDFHIDGFAKFYDTSTILTLPNEDLLDWGVSEKDIKTLMNAKNSSGNQYKFKTIPLTENNVVLDSGKDLGYRGSYINFYIGNKVILVPNYNDANDKVSNDIIQSLYPDRKVVGIDVRELYKNGGMIHCITQQQPIKLK